MANPAKCLEIRATARAHSTTGGGISFIAPLVKKYSFAFGMAFFFLPPHVAFVKSSADQTSKKVSSTEKSLCAPCCSTR